MKTLTESLEMGRNFTWGPIVRCVEFGPYAFIEHQARVYKNNRGTNRFEGTEYSLFVDGVSISMVAKTIEEAMATVLAYKFDGPNSQAGRLFLNMIGYKAGAR